MSIEVLGLVLLATHTAAAVIGWALSGHGIRKRLARLSTRVDELRAGHPGRRGDTLTLPPAPPRWEDTARLPRYTPGRARAVR